MVVCRESAADSMKTLALDGKVDAQERNALY